MVQYYLVNAFFIEKQDLWPPDPELAKIHPNKVITFIATKTIGGFKEIKSGNFIPDVSLIKHTSVTPQNQGHAYIRSDRVLKSLETTGAVIVTCSSYEDKLIRPVENIEDVKDYLKKDLALEAFKMLAESRKKGVQKYKLDKSFKKNEKKNQTKDKLENFKEKIISDINKIKNENELNNEIKKEIKRTR